MSPTSDIESYVICTAPRSGSTLLCLMLAGTGVAGAPQSWFHAPSVARWAETLGVEVDPDGDTFAQLAEIFEAARAAGSAGGLFGLRLQAPSLDFFRTQLRLLHPEAGNDVARIEARFGATRFLYLHRADKLDQAISRLMAQQTGLWHQAADGRDIERRGAAGVPVYDADALRAEIAELEALDRLWEDWFAAEGLRPLRIDYDALAGDPRGVLREVLVALGRDPATVDGVAVPTRKLAGETFRNWARRYRAEAGSR